MRSNKIETILMGIALIMLTIAMLVVAMFSYTDNVALAYKQGEDAIKAETAASARALPFDQTPIGDKCVCCGKPADKVVYFAKSY